MSPAVYKAHRYTHNFRLAIEPASGRTGIDARFSMRASDWLGAPRGFPVSSGGG
jgi:hypothetical protein